VRPEGVSLEQTLLGLYRENTQAFDGNMNRLKAGKTLNVPSAEKWPPFRSRKRCVNSSCRRTTGVPTGRNWPPCSERRARGAGRAGQASSGKITPKVEDRAKPAPEAQQDVLKLSKATSPPAAPLPAKADEARALQEKLRAQEEDATAREKALQESISAWPCWKSRSRTCRSWST
jgi:pilus assembly protein FimV